MQKYGDTFKRIITTILFLPILLYAIFSPKVFVFLILVVILIILAQCEFYALFKDINLIQKILGILTSVALCSSFIFLTYNAVVEILSIYILFSLLIELIKINKDIVRQVSISCLGVIYIGLLLSHLILLHHLHQGKYYLLILFLITWVSDISGYFVGKFCGRIKIFGDISPNKTIEGSCAIVIAAIIVSVITNRFFIEVFNFYHSLILGFILGGGCLLGDLVESLFKRSTNVKDTSNLIPGHGGVLDVFDSMLFTAPLMYYFTVISYGIIFG